MPERVSHKATRCLGTVANAYHHRQGWYRLSVLKTRSFRDLMPEKIDQIEIRKILVKQSLKVSLEPRKICTKIASSIKKYSKRPF